MLHENNNGFVERKPSGRYEGNIFVDEINLSPVEGQYFKKDGKTYLWLKRKPMLVYDEESQTFRMRTRMPQWEVYMEKQTDNSTIAYKGEFAFLRFKYSIVGIWDAILGKERNRLNLFVERLPMKNQTILNSINERNRERSNKGNND